MEEQQQGSEERREGARDGSIDFAHYSLEQLNQLRFVIDSNAYPVNYANLVAELQRRAAAAPQDARMAPPPPEQPLSGTVTVRFTPHGGLRGWLEAKSRWQPLYGDGFVEVRAEELVLAGWQRNWLGIGQRTEVFIPLRDVSDVIQGDGQQLERDWIRLRYQTVWGRYRWVEFQALSAEQASALVESLPKARSHTYERWVAVREFDARLREAVRYPWITTALVIANVAVYVATALVAKRLDVMAVPQAIVWGENFAPLTLHGQWWRLLSALFLHGNVAHVVLNMWALWNVGRLTERLYGNWTFAFLYFACGVLSGLASIVWDPSRATLGASGAIFAIFAAFIVFSLGSRSRAAVRVPAAMWVSSLVFAIYNLTAGFLTPGIDNAAHVGGALSGLLLGACLARPLTSEARRRVPVIRLASAVALTCLGVFAGVWQATGFGSQLTGPERYLGAHQWYIDGEAATLRTWREIAALASSGQASDEVVSERFARDILPFWETTSERLKAEEPSLPSDEREYASQVSDYSRARALWARAIVAVARGEAGRASGIRTYEEQSNLAVARAERIRLLATLTHGSRALMSSRPVLALSNWFIGRNWKCFQEAPRNPAMAKDSPTDGPAARYAAGCRAQTLFMSGDYEILDHWLEQSVGSLEDLPDGGSTLDGIVRGLSNLFSDPALDVSQTLGRTAEWRRRLPNSVYPELMQGVIFEAWAWAARGHGSARSVSPQTWAVFAERTAMADMSLSEAVEHANTNPLWYQFALDVGLDSSKPLDELRSIFNRGAAEEPHYWPLYTRMLRILMPRWLGGADEVKRFIDQVSQRPSGERNLEKYVRLYWSYSSLEEDDVALFDGSLADWSNMKAGFAELLRAHPKSDFVLNAYAKFACMARDAHMYGELRAQLLKRPSAAAWSDKVTLKHCDEEFPAEAAAARGHRYTPLQPNF